MYNHSYTIHKATSKKAVAYFTSLTTLNPSRLNAVKLLWPREEVIPSNMLTVNEEGL
jgi:hypothetical protein